MTQIYANDSSLSIRNSRFVRLYCWTCWGSCTRLRLAAKQVLLESACLTQVWPGFFETRIFVKLSSPFCRLPRNQQGHDIRVSEKPGYTSTAGVSAPKGLDTPYGSRRACPDRYTSHGRQ